MARVILENVRVDFPIYGAQQRSLRTAIFQRATGGLIQREGKNHDRVVVRALSNISLKLEEGDRLGLVGHNGSGKSTLLKVIAGIYEPVEGSILVDGRITPLFDMMPGLDIEDTGYENMFTSGMLLGLSRDLIESKIPEIEEFCELGEYLTLPVRTYSAGMITRLGFALVTALNPDVLLVDEGFGAGDLRFAERAAERMDEFIGRSRIMVLASHSDAMIKSICTRAALLQQGRIVSVGPVEDIFREYNVLVHGTRLKGTVPALVDDSTKNERVRPVFSEESIRDVGLADRLNRATGAVRFTKAVARDQSGQTKWTYMPGETATIHFEYEVLESVEDLAFLLRLYFPEDQIVGQPEQIISDIREVLCDTRVEAGAKGSFFVTLPNLKLLPNQIALYAYFGTIDNKKSYDVIDTNVGLPPLVICADNARSGIRLHGIVSLRYQFEALEFDAVEIVSQQSSS